MAASLSSIVLRCRGVSLAPLEMLGDMVSEHLQGLSAASARPGGGGTVGEEVAASRGSDAAASGGGGFVSKAGRHACALMLRFVHALPFAALRVAVAEQLLQRPLCALLGGKWRTALLAACPRGDGPQRNTLHLLARPLGVLEWRREPVDGSTTTTSSGAGGSLPPPRRHDGMGPTVAAVAAGGAGGLGEVAAALTEPAWNILSLLKSPAVAAGTADTPSSSSLPQSGERNGVQVAVPNGPLTPDFCPSPGERPAVFHVKPHFISDYVEFTPLDVFVCIWGEIVGHICAFIFLSGSLTPWVSYSLGLLLPARPLPLLPVDYCTQSPAPPRLLEVASRPPHSQVTASPLPPPSLMTTLLPPRPKRPSSRRYGAAMASASTCSRRRRRSAAGTRTSASGAAWCN